MIIDKGDLPSVKKWRWITPDGTHGLTTAPTIEAARERIRGVILEVKELPIETEVWEIPEQGLQHFGF